MTTTPQTLSKTKAAALPLALAIGFFAARLFLPAHPFHSNLDPWGLLNVSKLVQMLLAIALIQSMGEFLNLILGLTRGVLVTGFLGGLISSTAVTVTLAKESRLASSKSVGSSQLLLFSANLAMLFEAAAMVLIGESDIQRSIFVIFLGPMLTAVGILIFTARRKLPGDTGADCRPKFRLLEILKLGVFISAVLAVSKLAQRLLGQSALVFFTFAVSLFEIHGSVISNVQLHDGSQISTSQLAILLSVALLASLCSKLSLILFLGSRALFKEIWAPTALIAASVALSWALFAMLS